MQDTATISIHDGDALELPVGETLFKALRDHRVFIPTVCGGKGFCGKCRLRVIAGAPAALTASEQKLLSPDDIAGGIRLACQIVIAGDMTVALPDDIAGVNLFDAVVTELEDENPTIRRVRMRLLAPPVMDYLPGAFIILDIPPSAASPRGATRSYSIATPPESTKEIEINVKRVPGGIGSGYVHDTLRVGDRVTFTAPYSGYPAADARAPLVCVAGGSGISPVLSLLRHAALARTPRKTIFLYGAQTSADLLYTDELRLLEKALPDFTYVPVIQHPAGDEQTPFATGLVTERLRDFADVIRAGAAAYLCGPPGMIAAASNLLTENGMLPGNIFHDAFG